jgi:energy-coupling factor transporter transmembrane protein EcfT
VRVALHEIWGCGHGPVSRLAPQTRILAGAALFAACMVAPVPSRCGLALLAAAAVGWLAACRTPLRIVRSAVLLGLALFLPYFLLVPVIAGEPSTGTLGGALRVPSGVVAHGLAGMLVSIATVTALSASDLREGLLRLPVPTLVSAILLQIVNQTAALGYETRRIASAMAVRGASGKGVAALRVLVSLPQVWLPRVLVRAERVASAMDVRGYCEQGLPSFGAGRMGGRDAIALAAGVAALAMSIVARVRGLP